MSQLPLWFLILALFLPRISLIVAYFTPGLHPFHLTGWIPPVLAIFIPRILVMILIFQDRGFSLWLLLHAVVMAAVYSGGGRKSRRK